MEKNCKGSCVKVSWSTGVSSLNHTNIKHACIQFRKRFQTRSTYLNFSYKCRIYAVGRKHHSFRPQYTFHRSPHPECCWARLRSTVFYNARTFGSIQRKRRENNYFYWICQTELFQYLLTPDLKRHNRACKQGTRAISAILFCLFI